MASGPAGAVEAADLGGCDLRPRRFCEDVDDEEGEGGVESSVDFEEVACADDKDDDDGAGGLGALRLGVSGPAGPTSADVDAVGSIIGVAVAVEGDRGGVSGMPVGWPRGWCC